jgi:excisionase family DNA binding protein
MSDAEARAVMTFEEGADYMTVGKSTFYRLADRGVIPTIRVPGTSIRRVRRAVLDALLSEWENDGRRRRNSGAATTRRRRTEHGHTEHGHVEPL